jgi:hypothetical protein
MMLRHAALRMLTTGGNIIAFHVTVLSTLEELDEESIGDRIGSMVNTIIF